MSFIIKIIKEVFIVHIWRRVFCYHPLLPPPPPVLARSPSSALYSSTRKEEKRERKTLYFDADWKRALSLRSCTALYYTERKRNNNNVSPLSFSTRESRVSLSLNALFLFFFSIVIFESLSRRDF